MPICGCEQPGVNMMGTVFDCGSLNRNGICQSICAQWIRKSKASNRAITDIDELGQEHFLRQIWGAAPTNQGINALHLLGQPESRYMFTISAGTFDTSIVARELTRGWNRYFLFGVDGTRGGHAMATKLMAGDIEFLDPNFACLRFGNSRQLYEFISTHIEAHYPNLLSRRAEVLRYAPTAVRAMAS